MKRFFRSFVFAAQGIGHALAKERNFLVQVAIAIIVLLLSAALRISSMEWTIILMNTGMVLGFEMINSCIERICNLVHPQHSSLVKIIKDLAAGAVLVVSIVATVCGLIIFIPKIF